MRGVAGGVAIHAWVRGVLLCRTFAPVAAALEPLAAAPATDASFAALALPATTAAPLVLAAACGQKMADSAEPMFSSTGSGITAPALSAASRTVQQRPEPSKRRRVPEARAKNEAAESCRYSTAFLMLSDVQPPALHMEAGEKVAQEL